MTDIRKLAAKHALGIVDHHSNASIETAIVRALKEYQKSAVIDVVQGSPSSQLVAERIARARPMPPVTNHSTGANISRQIMYRDILAYAVEQGRELERKAQADRPLEYGWEWASNPSTGPHIIHGSNSKESAERAMEKNAEGSAIGWPPIRIMVREKAVAGPWREA